MGHGYLDVAALAHSTAIGNLANVDRAGDLSFAPILKAMGENVAWNMKFKNSFRCLETNIHPSAVNTSDLQVEIANLAAIGCGLGPQRRCRQ